MPKEEAQFSLDSPMKANEFMVHSLREQLPYMCCASLRYPSQMECLTQSDGGLGLRTACPEVDKTRHGLLPMKGGFDIVFRGQFRVINR